MADSDDHRSGCCAVCGKEVPAGMQCSYCLLQLGLSTGGTSRSSAGYALSSGSERFILQGVLAVFGDYVLEAEIARGGMGVVYRARQISLDRTVAIKMILAGQLASPEMVQRFRLEAQSASRLRHPGIIPIYEIGEWETQHYFSMEWVDGASLAECLEDFRLKADANSAERKQQQLLIAELMSRVARALDFAHKRGVLHRDVKPSNILIDERGEPRLTDFGLAKLTGRTTRGMTAATAVLGTPGYAAPEQGFESESEVTTAADVYGFGATLYELLTGKPPFVGATALATMRMAGAGPPVAPRQINPAVHRDLETIAMRCLEREPLRRYHSAESVAEDLERFTRGEPITARPVSRFQHVAAWCRRNPWFTVSLGLLLIAIIGGGGTSLWQWRRVQRVNAQLNSTVADLKWDAIGDMIKQGQASTALATVASLIRQNPQDPRPVMFVMSLMQQRCFPVPVAPQILHPQGAALSVARLSPDGTRVATASFDGTVRIWDAMTSIETVGPLKHQSAVHWVEFSPDGRTLASGSEDKTVRLWDVRTGQPRCKPIQQNQAVERVYFSSDGSSLLVQTQNSVSILRGGNGEIVAGPIVQQGSIVAAGFVSGGFFFTAQSGDKTSGVCLWDVRSGMQRAKLATDSLQKADMNPTASRVAVVGDDGRAWVADFPSGEHRSDLAKDNLIRQVVFSSKGNRIALLGLANWARVFDADTARPVTGELPHNYVLNGASFFDDDRKLLTWGSDALAQVWNIDDNNADCEPMRHQYRIFHAEPAWINGTQFFLTTQTHSRSHSTDAGSVDAGTGAAQLWAVAPRHDPGDRFFGKLYPGFDATRFSPDGRMVAFGMTEDAHNNEEIKVVWADSGLPVCKPLIVKGGTWGLMFTPDGSRLISTTSAGQVTIWSIPTGTPIAGPYTVPTEIHPAEISPDGKMFATGSIDGIVRLWDTATCRPVHEMNHAANIHSLAFSSDGSMIASAGADRVVRIWNTNTGNEVRDLIGHQNEVMTVAFSPDGKKLVTGSFDFTARIWDAATGKTRAVLPHQGEVLDVAFSPDNRYVATCSRDRTAVIWDAATGLAHTHNLLHEQAVRNVRFSPDGTRLFTLDFHGLQAWDVVSGHPLTVHLPHEMDGGPGFQTSAFRFDLTPDGQNILLGGDSQQIQIWHLPNPTAGTPAWFPDFIESVAGERLIPATDLPESVPPYHFLQIAAKIKDSMSTDYYTQWTRQWLACKTTAVAGFMKGSSPSLLRTESWIRHGTPEHD